MKKLKILLVEDDEHDYFIFKRYLSEIKNVSYFLTWADTFKKGIAEIEKDSHDIYIFDYILGIETGIDLIKHCNALEIQAPILLLTGVGSQATDIQAVELGAADYLVKSDINAITLERSLRHAVKQAETLSKLKAGENKFRNIFENSYDVIFIADEKGNLIDINKSAERLFGYEKNELLTMNISEVFEVKKDYEKFNETLLLIKVISNYEAILTNKNKNKKFCLITATVHTNEEGETFCYGIICDYTKRKKTEQDLIMAEKFAVTGRVIRTLAHEVRNPLTNIYLATELLQDEVKSEAALPYIDILKRNSNRINEIIRSFLNNSTPADLKLSQHNIQDILNETISLAKDRATLKRIEIKTEFDNAQCKITADDEKLKIAFANILVNAIEAVEEGKGKIFIQTIVNDKKVKIFFKDNGPGISSEHIQKIFEPYYTLKPNGVGLGLSATNNIIKSMDGTIDVESETGKGTNFIIQLNHSIPVSLIEQGKLFA